MSAAEPTVRAFFAVELPEAVRAEAANVARALRDEVGAGLRLTPVENLHLTLKFLGDVAQDVLPRLLARAAVRLAPERPFEVTLAGLGAFPNARAARVVWIGAGAGAAPLAKLARKLEAAGKGVGAPRERRPFHAHLTLARLREPRRVPIERLPGPDSGGFSVEEVVLYESRLSSSGASYSPLARLPLGADAVAPEFAPEL